MEERQFSLFKGARQRGTRLPAPHEFALHCQVADIAARWITPQWQYTHLAAGEHRSKATAARLKRMGLRPGWPDFLFVGPCSVFFLELKRRGQHQSDEQANVALHIIRSGFEYLCVDNLDAAVDALRVRGIVRARVSA